MSKVKVREEIVELLTYGIGEAEKNPMFLEKRVYQGSSGAVYPYPVVEKIEDKPTMKPYRAILMENEYIELMILPELGGRIQMAYDKIKERHFIYFNQVIKPALVGLTGPWISGGIEFNWPQHHRPSTYLPVDYTIEEGNDGSATVWIHERERMTHQKGMAGFTLRPAQARIEITGKVQNPTPVPQTFLWWANPAVAVNDAYQSVFPQDVNAVFDHGKRDVSSYPIATGTYYKMDYSAGVDISRYKNIPVPTSFMAARSDYDFIGGYENDTRGGLLHVANHHVSPGKKQWTWGYGDFGQAWDRNLTDEDGPYIELMTGVYTDNQPDFSWLQPYEEKTFTQYFIPYRELGVVKNATKDILMNIEMNEEGSEAIIRIMTTSTQEYLRIFVCRGYETIADRIVTIHPEMIFEQEIETKNLDGCSVLIKNPYGKELLFWEAPTGDSRPLPEAAKTVLSPKDTPTCEQLFLSGLHLEQNRHATYSPVDYYEEALRRDPSDIRNNNALGLWYIRKGCFAKAEGFLRAAIETQTERSLNPYDGEPTYNLGLSLKYQGKTEEAYDAFYKACWNAAWMDSGYYALAQLSAKRKDWEEALYEVEKSLMRNYTNMRARHLKAYILRQMGRKAAAEQCIYESLQKDPFNFGCRMELCFLYGKKFHKQDLIAIMREDAHNYEELITDYIDAYAYKEAIAVVDLAIEGGVKVSSMMLYYKAYCQIMTRRLDDAAETALEAEKDFRMEFFPNHTYALLALQAVSNLKEVQTPKALYLLGNIWYDRRQYDRAVEAWEAAASIERFPTTLRNLSIAYFNKLDRKEEAVALLEEAFALNTSDARVLMELDQLYKRLDREGETRLNFLDNHKEVAFQRDDIYLEYATLLNRLERHQEALDMLLSRHFHPWEGGEGKVVAQYHAALVALTKQALADEQYEVALETIEKCYTYPHNLGEGKLHGAQENDFNFYKGCALEGLGKAELAAEAFQKASKGNTELAAAMYYNDQNPEKIFFQGLALRKLGREKEATKLFKQLVSYGKKHLKDACKMDYFAVSLPEIQLWEDDMNKRNVEHCNRLMELGRLGTNA